MLVDRRSAARGSGPCRAAVSIEAVARSAESRAGAERPEAPPRIDHRADRSRPRSRGPRRVLPGRATSRDCRCGRRPAATSYRKDRRRLLADRRRPFRTRWGAADREAGRARGPKGVRRAGRGRRPPSRHLVREPLSAVDRRPPFGPRRGPRRAVSNGHREVRRTTPRARGQPSGARAFDRCDPHRPVRVGPDPPPAAPVLPTGPTTRPGETGGASDSGVGSLFEHVSRRCRDRRSAASPRFPSAPPGKALG